MTRHPLPTTPERDQRSEGPNKIEDQAKIAGKYRECTEHCDWLIGSARLGTTAHTRTDISSLPRSTFFIHVCVYETAFDRYLPMCWCRYWFDLWRLPPRSVNRCVAVDLNLERVIRISCAFVAMALVTDWMNYICQFKLQSNNFWHKVCVCVMYNYKNVRYFFWLGVYDI